MQQPLETKGDHKRRSFPLMDGAAADIASHVRQETPLRERKYQLSRRVVFFLNPGRVSAFTTEGVNWSDTLEILEIAAQRPQFLMSPAAFSLLKSFESPHSITEVLARENIAPAHHEMCRSWLKKCLERKILAPAGATHIIFRRPESKRVFFLYEGQNYFLMGHPLEFLKSTKLVDSNLVMFRDPSAMFYQRGISREIPDYQSFVEWHRGFLAESPGLKACCVGTSMGAFAAIQMGHILRAPTVWAFALPVIQNQFGVPNGQSDEQAEWPSEWGDNKCHANVVNLKKLIEKHNGITTYHLFFNARFEGDAAAARALQDCPGVRLHPQDGEVHDVVRIMAAQDTLERVADIQ